MTLELTGLFGYDIRDKNVREEINNINDKIKGHDSQLGNIANEDLTIGEDGKLHIKQGDGTEKGNGVEIPTGTAEVPSNIVLYEEIEDEGQETLIPINSPNGTTYYLAVDDSGALTVQNTSGETVWEGGGTSIEGVYFISNRLTNIVSNNTDKNVLEGDSYVATLTPTSGYEISDITVKMGNVDITSTAYADGNINIASVTGNIVITATATKIPTKYNVANNLTNATNSNSVTQVNENTSYVATISANEGYELSSVIVTMGGTDITSAVYADGNINITSVTGDIVITVTTSKVTTTTTVDVLDVAEETYTDKKANLSSSSGYTTYKISNVKAGDIITTALANNSGQHVFNYIGNSSGDLTSSATKSSKDNYSWYKYSITVTSDYDVFYICASTSKIAEGRITWTKTR